MPVKTPRERVKDRSAILLAYAAFILSGIGAGVNGVLLPAQMRDYGVDRSTIGITFFACAAGFTLSSLLTGTLIQRWGMRTALVAGAAVCLVADLGMAMRPPFPVFVAMQLMSGIGIGILESLLNVYLTHLPKATAFLNRLHAYFGVGALIGPAFGAWILRRSPWTSVYLLLALATVPLIIGFRVAYSPGVPAESSPTDAPHPAGTANGKLLAALRTPAVLLASAFLAAYVGAETSVGNWGFSYLVVGRGHSDLLAGYAVSGYWLGLTLGRFLISPASDRLRLSVFAMVNGCLVGMTLSIILIWSVPAVAASVAGLFLLGFFLGPMFPTTMAIVPTITGPELVPTAIGILNGVSVAGTSVIPWLAGTLTQEIGMWTLAPFTASLGVLQLVLWLRLSPGRAKNQQPMARMAASS